MRLFLYVVFLLSTTAGLSQSMPLPEDTTVSVITFGPGSNLNDAFGHNAIRIKSRVADIAYDFGRYNFDDPNFYLDFARGKLNYLQGKSNYKNLIAFYISENRTIKEQQLRLSQAETQELYNYLEANYKKNQGAYLYDFFYDNCATKIRDVLEENINGNITYNNPENYSQETFRTLIQNNLNRNSWGSLGIDLALGSIIDQKASPREYMFLPENIFNFYQLASFKKTNTPVVKQSKVLYQSKNKKETGSFLLRPFFVLSLIALLILWLTYRDYKNAKRNKTLDVSIHLITGITGVLLMLLWFATTHTATQNNYNLLWAFPIGIIAFLQALKAVPKRWYIGYLKLLIIMLCLMSLHWIIGVQRFAPTLLPVIIALFIRYVYLIRYYKQQETS